MRAFETALTQERPRLLRRAHRLCANASEAEDLVQDTLMLALRHEGAFSHGTNLTAWLYAIMKNTYRNDSRKAQRRRFLSTDLPILTAQESPANQEFSTALAQLWARIRALPRAQQEVLILIAIEGRSYAEAAQITGAPVGTVRSRLARARNAVQQGFQDKEEYSVD